MGLPKLPSTADPTDLLGTAPLDAYLVLLADTDATNNVYEKALLMYGYKVVP